MERARATGLAAIVLLGGAAGFMVASSALGHDFQPIGFAADAGRAYTLNADDGVVRFEMMASDSAIDPAATFALYAPDDEFFGYYELDADWPTEDVHVDRSGQWVVVIYELREAELSVSGNEDSLIDDTELVPAETIEKRVTVAEAAGDAVRVSSSLASDGRPAQAILEYDGSVTGLDAVVSSTNGPVFELQGVSTNTTEDGATYQVAGATIASPQNLADGTYQVRLTADALDGRIDLVFVDYVRDATERIDSHSVDCAQAKEAEEDERDHDHGKDAEDEAPECLVTKDGLISLTAQEPLAVMVPDAAGALELTFAEFRFVDLSVYGPDDQLVHHVELGEAPDRYDQFAPGDWSGYSGSIEATETLTLPLNTTGEHVLYMRGFWGDVALARLTGVEDAPEVRALDLVYSEAYSNELVKFDTATFEVSLETPLLDLYAYDWSWAETRHDLTVEGPLGLVFESHRELSTLGATLGPRETAVYSENFVAGDYVVTADSEAIGNDMHIAFVTYER